MREKSNYVYRLCPCHPCDIEAVQSWLEDMAEEGLFLIKEGIFCNILFTFERRQPQRVSYRLDVAQKRKARFMDSGDQLTNAELDLYREMGWEYLLQFGDFRIYRACCQAVPELNTESETHAFTINLLKKNQRSALFGAIAILLLWLFLGKGALGRVFLVTATVGPLVAFCIYGCLLSTVLAPLGKLLRYRRYEKRLLAGDTLNHWVHWRKKRVAHYGSRLLSLLLFVGVVAGLLFTYYCAREEHAIADYEGEPPFAAVADVFPDAAEIRQGNSFDYYGSYETMDTFVSDYTKWKESCYVTTAEGERYFCILIIDYYDTPAEWFARGVERDCYLFDAARIFRGKTVEYDAPELDVDSIRVYNQSAGITVLMREDTWVVRATVLLDDGDNHNQWQLWAEAMAEKLKE